MKLLTKLLMGLILALTLQAGAQTKTQTLRGQVLDKDSKYPLQGSVIRITTDSSFRKFGAVADENGNYRIEGVPLGRHSVSITSVGYQSRNLDNIEVSSGKEVILNLELESKAITTSTAKVSSRRNNGEVLNEMALVSARSFTVEETDRFAGSRGDPSRMASNYAGVQGADDSRNDIVIRGNSPYGLLWRFEGINIPNPNHFNIPGTTGGPVTILNNKYLANSDFFTGAFPAEYGNANAGVFDLRMRNGNNEKYEHSVQFGVLGTELFSEGPISKKRKSSYLASFRYSSLALFSKVGFQLGTSAVPRYLDGAFRLNFPLGKKTQLSLWGIGGDSHIDILISQQPPGERNIYAENDRDQYFQSYMITSGVSLAHTFNPKSYLKISAGFSHNSIPVKHDYLIFNGARDTVLRYEPLMRYTFNTTQYSLNAYYTYKLSPRLTLKTGLINELYRFNFHDSARVLQRDSAYNYVLSGWYTRWNSDEYAALLQPFAQLKYKAGSRLSLTAGWHMQFFTLNKELSWLEPRIGGSYHLKEGQKLSFGSGLHSQIQAPYSYFYILPGNTGPHNKTVGYSKSWHNVLGYDWFIGQKAHFKTEVYYQWLYRIPVRTQASSLSLANSGSGFARLFPDTLTNKGVGQNYGIEFTFERFFGKTYFFMATASLFSSTYQGSDGIWRSTDYNSGYAANALFTREFKLNKNLRLQTGGKFTYAGGRPYSPADTAASNNISELVDQDAARNSLRLPDYKRLDIRVSVKYNAKRVNHELAVDLINVLNFKNVLKLTYAPDPASGNNVRFEYQLGFLPLVYYRLDF